MRVKTEARRDAIVEAAARVFRDMGYERATMGEISARVGGSKATLYSYFPSKEELFAAVMVRAMEGQAESIVKILAQPLDDVEEGLRRFARAYVDLVAQPDFLAFRRVGVAEGANSGLGPKLYEIGPLAGLRDLAEFLQSHMSAGRLRSADPWLAALQLDSLLEAGIVEPLLHGTDMVVDRDDALETAIQTYLRGYSPEHVRPLRSSARPGSTALRLTPA